MLINAFMYEYVYGELKVIGEEAVMIYFRHSQKESWNIRIMDTRHTFEHRTRGEVLSLAAVLTYSL
jgi:hypothetical protein